ncbi:hypothetical protein ScPMuIL_000469 [Solemya velum]
MLHYAKVNINSHPNEEPSPRYMTLSVDSTILGPIPSPATREQTKNLLKDVDMLYLFGQNFLSLLLYPLWPCFLWYLYTELV